MSLDFVAVDVETANEQRGSICSFGLSVVENGNVVRTENWLTRPPGELDWFDGFNIGLHAITPAMVKDAPPFQERMAQVLEVIGGRPVVAHNAAFDLGAIRQGCDADALDWPELTYGCTLVLSRRILNLLSYRLPIVCAALDIPLLAHHEAGADANAAALIALELARRQQAASLEELAAGVQMHLGKVSGNAWSGCARTLSGSGVLGQTPGANPDADPAHPFYGQTMVFTGALSLLPRQDAWAAVASLGATPEQGVNKRTTMLVIGDGFAGNCVEEFHSGKAAKAVHWQAKGHTIEVLTEDDFFGMLEEKTSSGTHQGRMQNAECRMQNAECRMQNAECRTQNAERRTQNAERRTQNAERRTQNAERRTQNAERTRAGGSARRQDRGDLGGATSPGAWLPFKLACRYGLGRSGPVMAGQGHHRELDRDPVLEGRRPSPGPRLRRR